MGIPGRLHGLRSAAALCAALLAGIGLATLAADSSLRLFLPDSATYLQTAIAGTIPVDRSFLYGWLVRATAVAAGSGSVLVAVQLVSVLLAAWMLFGWLTRTARVRPALALLAALAFAIEPAQQFYARMLMAESAGLLLFLAGFCSASAYVQRGRLAWLGLAIVLGVGAVALRLSLLPVALALGLVAPVLRLAWPGDARRRTVLLHGALALGLTMLAHHGYREAYGTLVHGPAAYLGSAGRFRLGLVAPLVEAEHFTRAGVPAGLLEQVTIDRRDPRLREAQVWLPGGLVDVLARHVPDPEGAAALIADAALRERPLGLLPLAADTLAAHFDAAVVRDRLEDDLGRRAPNARIRSLLRERLGVDTTPPAEPAPARRWFALGAPWLIAALLVLPPLALATGWLSRGVPGAGARALLALVSLGLVASYLLFSPIVSLRYLHPLPWFVLANAALLTEALLHRVYDARTRSPGKRSAPRAAS